MCEETKGRDAKSGQFQPGHRISVGNKGPSAKSAPSTDDMRGDFLRNWNNMGSRGQDAFLNALRKKSPEGFSKIMVSLIPKDRNTVVNKQIVMPSFIEAPPANWTPDDGHEGDDVSEHESEVS